MDLATAGTVPIHRDVDLLAGSTMFKELLVDSARRVGRRTDDRRREGPRVDDGLGLGAADIHFVSHPATAITAAAPSATTGQSLRDMRNPKLR